MPHPTLDKFNAILAKTAPYMANTVEKARARFGEEWADQFEETLAALLNTDEALQNAAKGYVRFALDATRLQKAFEKERVYRAKTYAEAAQEVYHNREYMEGLYLPGILLSHYLWPHHYSQMQYFKRRFVPLAQKLGGKRFCDVGIGSGFYSRQMLKAMPGLTGAGFDISEHSIAYSRRQIAAFGLSDRWSVQSRDVVQDTPEERFDLLMSVEVLEHLEDPVSFLRALRKMLRPGGYGFITAAITAPNADHIYLYNSSEDVSVQIREAGFSIVEYQEDLAYQPKAGEPVPRLTAFIVQ